MPTIRLPGGHRITGVPDIRPGRDFTPTLQEAFWAYVLPPNVFRIFSDKSGEQQFYFSFKLGIATVGAFITGGDSIAAYSFMRTAQFMSSPAVLPLLPIALFKMNKAVIESAPPEDQQSLWQIFGQAISGTGQPGIHHIPGS